MNFKVKLFLVHCSRHTGERLKNEFALIRTDIPVNRRLVFFLQLVICLRARERCEGAGAKNYISISC